MNVVKGAGRAKHEAGKKHQQRTPLPPRTGEQKSPEEYRAETEELRIDLRPKKEKKPKKDKAAKVAKEAATVLPAGPSAPSYKANVLAAQAQELGWVTDVVEFDGGKVQFTATRDDEQIVCGWTNGAWVYPNFAKYTIGSDRSVNVKNASEARKLMAVPVESVPRRVARRSKGDGETVADAATIVRRLPFDPETAEDDVVLEKVTGKKLVWVNSITGGVENSSIPRTMFTKEVDKATGQKLETERQTTNKHLKITRNSAGRRIINWVASDGYRAVYVDALMQVR